MYSNFSLRLHGWSISVSRPRVLDVSFWECPLETSKNGLRFLVDRKLFTPMANRSIEGCPLEAS